MNLTNPTNKKKRIARGGRPLAGGKQAGQKKKPRGGTRQSGASKVGWGGGHNWRPGGSGGQKLAKSKRPRQKWCRENTKENTLANGGPQWAGREWQGGAVKRPRGGGKGAPEQTSFKIVGCCPSGCKETTPTAQGKSRQEMTLQEFQYHKGGPREDGGVPLGVTFQNTRPYRGKTQTPNAGRHPQDDLLIKGWSKGKGTRATCRQKQPIPKPNRQKPDSSKIDLRCS